MILKIQRQRYINPLTYYIFKQKIFFFLFFLPLNIYISQIIYYIFKQMITFLLLKHICKTLRSININYVNFSISQLIIYIYIYILHICLHLKVKCVPISTLHQKQKIGTLAHFLFETDIRRNTTQTLNRHANIELTKSSRNVVSKQNIQFRKKKKVSLLLDWRERKKKNTFIHHIFLSPWISFHKPISLRSTASFYIKKLKT